MIDFRYHVVSLVAVFLALAVGIVLGAGPLRENLGDQLTGQVEQLRAEQDRLRTENEDLAARNDQLASFTASAAPELVKGGLASTRVAVITDDDSTDPVLQRTDALLREAGAVQGPRILLRPAMWDPKTESERRSAVEELKRIDEGLVDSASGSSEQIAVAVVALLDTGSEKALGKAEREAAWKALTDAQLVVVQGDALTGADALLFASAEPDALTAPGDADAVAAERARQLQQLHTAALAAIVKRDVPTVVAGMTSGNDTSRSILRTVRADSAFAPLSTTDRLQEPDGPVLAVLALIEQVHGGVGDYGTAADAEARMPAHALDRASSAASDGGGEG